MRYWTSVLVNTLLFMAIAGLMPNHFQVSSVVVALLASIVLSILNFLIKPFLVILSLPITFLTLGLFSVVINGFMLELTASFVGTGFYIAGFSSAMLMAVILSVANSIISKRIR